MKKSSVKCYLFNKEGQVQPPETNMLDGCGVEKLKKGWRLKCRPGPQNTRVESNWAKVGLGLGLGQERSCRLLVSPSTDSCAPAEGGQMVPPCGADMCCVLAHSRTWDLGREGAANVTVSATPPPFPPPQVHAEAAT